MDAGRQREERDRQHQRPDQQAPRVVAAGDRHERDEGGDGEEERADQLPGDRGGAQA